MDVAHDVARRLHADPHDQFKKAVGWMLREAGKADSARLERYLRAIGAARYRGRPVLRSSGSRKQRRLPARGHATDYGVAAAADFRFAIQISSVFKAITKAAIDAAGRSGSLLVNGGSRYS